jgi:OmcA/MtrC family decaheme c-type cytochrome
MNRGSCARTFIIAGLATWFAACSGSDGKDGKSCSIQRNDAGVNVLVCPDNTTAPLGSTVSIPAADGGATSCTIASVDGGAKKIVCPDGTEVVLPAPTPSATNPDAAIGTACTVVANGDGTANMTCPGGDGGMVTVTIKNALANYTTMTAEDRAALDMKVTIDSVTIPATGNPVVTFRVNDRTGNAVAGLPPADMRFALLKLVPATTGGNDTWLSYMAANATSTAGTETAAATASASSGALLDNGDGGYTYAFAKNVLNAAAAGTAYDANAAHRLVMLLYESGNPFAPVNVVKDFVPALGLDVTGKAAKVDGTACLECHSSFRAPAGGSGAFHSGTRYDIGTCVACHNDQRRYTAIPGTGATPNVDLDAPGVVDPATGAWTGAATLVNGEAFVNLPVFIHKIHMGDELTLQGGSYTGVDKPYDTTYPQDVRNCVKCHANVPQANNFKNKPSRRVCGSCHDNVSFAAATAIPAGRTAHLGGPAADDSTCATCHPASAPKTQVGYGVFDAHVAVAAPDPTATWLGGTNANTNAGYIPAAGVLPAGAAKITYQVKSVARDVNKHPSITFQLVKDLTPVVFNTYAAGVVTELMDGFVGSPSVYFAFAVPQDGITAPADFNASASGYIKNIWNATATGSGAGTMTFDATSGYYTITLTGVVVPDTAIMLTGGVGYTYSLSSTPPLTQINLPAFPYGTDPIVKGCIASQMCGGLIVAAPDVYQVATDTATGKAYAARRGIVKNDNCKACHEQLGANPSFHAGQRNDGPTCAFCHNPNRTSGGWSASSSTFIHGIHGAAFRNVKFSWHAACTTGSFAAGTCTLDNADSFADVTYPGILNNCQQCHLPGTYDFSASASASAVSSLLMSTVGTGSYTPDISTSPYVLANGTDYGSGFSTSNLTSGTKDGVACTSAAPCACSLSAPCQASSTTLVSSPIVAACSACHDSANDLSHMRQMGGTFYGTRASALASSESCMMCHGPGTVAAIADVHGK